jgi:transcriptional regulator with GAF, ATPase, and Fis domain
VAGALGRVEEALRASGGNVAKAARALGLHRAQVYDILRRHGRDPSSYREPS